ncbi:MAG: DoxX family protein [Myxococcota bacterium]
MSTVSSSTASVPTTGKGLHIGLWVVQGLLAAAFGLAGVMKLTTPIAELAQTLPWVTESGAGLVRFIGASELAGAVGLILPSALRIQPKLTALAAAGLVLVMILASAFHLSRGEGAAVPVNLVLGGLAAFVAWGRWSGRPIAARG